MMFFGQNTCVWVFLQLSRAVATVRRMIWYSTASRKTVNMCILFLYVNNNTVDVDEYQVIIAMNRDEFIDRLTLPAHFWNEHCIGG